MYHILKGIDSSKIYIKSLLVVVLSQNPMNDYSKFLNTFKSQIEKEVLNVKQFTPFYMGDQYKQDKPQTLSHHCKQGPQEHSKYFFPPG